MELLLAFRGGKALLFGFGFRHILTLFGLAVVACAGQEILAGFGIDPDLARIGCAGPGRRLMKVGEQSWPFDGRCGGRVSEQTLVGADPVGGDLLLCGLHVDFAGADIGMQPNSPACP